MVYRLICYINRRSFLHFTGKKSLIPRSRKIIYITENSKASLIALGLFLVIAQSHILNKRDLNALCLIIIPLYQIRMKNDICINKTTSFRVLFRNI